MKTLDDEIDGGELTLRIDRNHATLLYPADLLRTLKLKKGDKQKFRVHYNAEGAVIYHPVREPREE